MKRISTLLTILLVFLWSNAQDSHTFPLKDTSRSYVRLLFAGDAMQHSPQFKAAWNASTQQYDYEPNFRYLRRYLINADVNIINLETTLSGEPYSGYPMFRTPDAYLNELLDAGFDVFALANNHVLDGGEKGVRRTLAKLSLYPNMGVYCNPTERGDRYPLILRVDGMKIALFNATYATNGFKPLAPTLVNYIDTIQIKTDLAKSMRDTTIDLRIMYIHWGVEYQLKHNTTQRQVAQYLADQGIDLVVGGHPHVVQDYELLTAVDGRKVPVIYSLGNLISNQRKRNTNGGIVAMVDIDRQTRKIVNINTIPVYVHKGVLLDERLNYYCIPTHDYLSNRLPFVLPSSMQRELEFFHNSVIKRIPSVPIE